MRLLPTLFTLFAAVLLPAASGSSDERQSGPADEVQLLPLSPPVSWVTADDYSTEALRNNQEGSVAMTLRIGTDGRPKDCRVERSSGVPVLDEQSCAILMQRSRFAPPRDGGGRSVEVSYRRNIRWQIPRSVDAAVAIVTVKEVSGAYRCSAIVRERERELTNKLCESLVASVKKSGMPLDQPIPAQFPDTPDFLKAIDR